MLIKNIYVYDHQGVKALRHVQVTEDGSKIIFNMDEDLTHLSETEKEIIDSQGCYFLMPGMFDTHVHGQGGIDFTELCDERSEKQLELIVQALGKTGLSYALATFVSMPIEALKKSLIKLDDFIHKQSQNPIPGSTLIVGVHLEGPFISKSCKGAHAEGVLQDRLSMEKFRDIIRVAPHIKQWKITIAPDLIGAEDFIKQTKDLEREGLYVKVFIGHCNPADKKAINRAISAGAVGFTHLGNACQESCSRETRVLSTQDVKSHLVQWILENPAQCPPGVELIMDGIHLSPSFISLIGPAVKNKVILITDALGATGCKDGLYKLGVLDIRKEQNSFYLADENGQFLMREGTLPSGDKGSVKILAGSAAPLFICAKNYFEWMGDETIEHRMDALYVSLVNNPRISSLSKEAIAGLPDDRNFSLFDKKGELILSLCQGKLTKHQPLQGVIPSMLQHGFLSEKQSINKGSKVSELEDLVQGNRVIVKCDLLQ